MTTPPWCREKVMVYYYYYYYYYMLTSVQWLDENACRVELICCRGSRLSCALPPISVSRLPTRLLVLVFPADKKYLTSCAGYLTIKVPDFVHWFLPINKKYQTSRAAYLVKMTADQSLFTELLPDKRKAANLRVLISGCQGRSS